MEDDIQADIRLQHTMPYDTTKYVVERLSQGAYLDASSLVSSPAPHSRATATIPCAYSYAVEGVGECGEEPRRMRQPGHARVWLPFEIAGAQSWRPCSGWERSTSDAASEMRSSGHHEQATTGDGLSQQDGTTVFAVINPESILERRITQADNYLIQASPQKQHIPRRA